MAKNICPYCRKVEVKDNKDLEFHLSTSEECRQKRDKKIDEELKNKKRSEFLGANSHNILKTPDKKVQHKSK